MIQTLAIAAGGAFGALMRHWVAGWTYAILGRGFPYGTLVVNVSGSLLMGFLFVWFTERSSLALEWRSLILVGFLGAFTTFSTFSLDTFNLIQDGAVGKALANVALSVGLCLLATWVGVLMGRQL